MPVKNECVGKLLLTLRARVTPVSVTLIAQMTKQRVFDFVSENTRDETVGPTARFFMERVKVGIKKTHTHIQPHTPIYDDGAQGELRK